MTNSIEQTTSKEEIMICADIRDLLYANNKTRNGGKGGSEYTVEAEIDYSIDWYFDKCFQPQGFLIPVYCLTFVEPLNDPDRRALLDCFKSVKLRNRHKIEKVREQWTKVNPIIFSKQGINDGRGLDLNNWLSDETIIFSIWMYCYENGGFRGPLTAQFKAHGKRMTRGNFKIRLIEIAVYSSTGEYELVFRGRTYSITDGRGYGEPCGGPGLLQEVVQEQAQNIQPAFFEVGDFEPEISNLEIEGPVISG